MKFILRLFSAVLLILVLYVAGILIHGSLNDYQPIGQVDLETSKAAITTPIEDSIITLVIWNIGYGGLGEESDFFFEDGGMLFSNGGMVRPLEEIVQKNQAGILNIINSLQADFYLFQEVDLNSKRSYFINQLEGISNILPGYSNSFATNYLSPRVPLPLFEPWNAYGKIESGLASFSKYNPKSSIRHQLPGEYSWPTKLFQLDRCALEQNFKLANGKTLTIFNIHNSAYDKGGVIKKEQMKYLKERFVQTYQSGHYVIAGGDWNQCPPFFDFDRFMPGKGNGYSANNIEQDFLSEDWRWVYDARKPTNRKVSDAFIKGSTFTTVIDFFLISPNIKVKKAKTIDSNFQFSDHQPVWMEIELLN